MVNNFFTTLTSFYEKGVMQYIQDLYANPFQLISLILDIGIVLFIIVMFIKLIKDSRAWQILKGIIFFLIAIALSSILNLHILNWILTSLTAYGVIAIIVIFQPELRRALEQLGTNKFTKFFGIDKDIATKTKEDIYKVVIAATELSKARTGALIVFERDIKVQDIISTGIEINSEISPQLLVNIFVPRTPLHDGAVIISNNKIAAAACMLPLANDKDISKELGTRHRAAIGMSKESDSIVVVVSEETGKMSVAKDGTLIADVKEEALRKILIKNLVTNRFEENPNKKMHRIKDIKFKFQKKDKDLKEDKNLK